ncbi:MAG: efflux RND transporter periplasmic adaptor subunit [Methylotenera sp.]|uniref:efflux RND transporter periplasmic adaptor subunit n=1 Tax=Methylotenera sp. TaxID=2051956 RepID=UPI00248A7E3B|nr:efflux RND transporter periplasmic adaptor subunit [Methylotenera sp.]MDI1309195.1 efflux RND transporter periplasmic adaptor subunit [Methylotenera sp.]
MQKNIKLFFIVIISTLMVACGAKDAASEKSQLDKKVAKPTLVTVTQVKNQAVETSEEAIGMLEGLTNPTISAEVAARVVKIHVNTGEAVKQGQLIVTLDASDFGMQRNEAQAEVARIQALLSNQIKTVERNQALVNKKFISQNAVDNEVAQQNVLKEQLIGAKARVGSINHTSSKTKIYAPASGNVEKKLVDDGEFVKVGDPMIMIVSKQHLRAHLPFPEYIAAKLKPGLEVRLTSPTSETIIKSTIHDLKPMIVEGSQTVDVIADIIGSPDWQPGASVTGTVILGEQAAAMMVPEQSVVLRPAGEVVYIVRNNKAYQAIVKTGAHQNGMVELLSGVKENDTIVVDGAGFLTDDTDIKIASTPTDANTDKAANTLKK